MEQTVHKEVKEGAFQQRLTLFDSVMIVSGVMIGSGIFIVDAEIGRNVGGTGWMLVVWLLTGVLTIAGALSYGELAAMMPTAGGMYVYLREAFSPLCGFLYGWTFLSVIQTGTIAAVAIAFARFSGVIFPAIAEDRYLVPPHTLIGKYAVSLSTVQVVAIFVIGIVTLINMLGVRWGSVIQNIFTVAKLCGIAALILLGISKLWTSPGVLMANFAHPWQRIGFDGVALSGSVLIAICVSQTGSLFSADSWHDITFIAGEIRNPKRNLPAALAIGTISVIVIYLLCNLCYLAILSLKEIQTAPGDRVATRAVEHAFGQAGQILMSGLIMVSTFGTINALTLAGARANYAMAKDGLFFLSAAKLNSAGVPATALLQQGFWSIILVLPRIFISETGRYGNLYSNLLDYVISAALLFYILTVAGLFRLRRTRANAERPYQCWGYPWLPGIYIVGCSVILGVLLIERASSTWPGFLVVATGAPAYVGFRRLGATDVSDSNSGKLQ